MPKHQTFTLTCFAVLLPANAALPATQNLLRNGSFDGGTLYGHSLSEWTLPATCPAVCSR